MQLIAWKKFLSIYLASYFIFKLGFYFIKRSSVGYDRVHIFRLSQIIDINFIMFLGTLFIYVRLHWLFQPTDPKEHHLNTANVPEASRQIKIFNIFFIIFALMCHWSHFTFYFFNADDPTPFPYLCLLFFGIWTHLVVLLLAFGVLNFLSRLLQSVRFGKECLKSLFKHLYLKLALTNAKVQTVIAIVLTAVLTVVQMIGADLLFVKNVTIFIPNLPYHFEGFKIVLLSDLHAGPAIGHSALNDIVDVVNPLNADIVVISGDMVDGSCENLRSTILPVKNLKAKYGTYFATGNHEYYYGKIDQWFQYITDELNMKVLHNSHSKIRIGKQEPHLCLAGVDDIFSNYLQLPGHGLDVYQAFNTCDSNSLKILLAHNPKGAKLAADKYGSIDLILSGHVHAGQMYVLAMPFYFTTPYFYGLYRHQNGRTQIYVTAGTRFWGSPLKMLGMAQVTAIQLTGINKTIR